MFMFFFCTMAIVSLVNCQNDFYQTLKVVNSEGGFITLPTENPKQILSGEAETIEAAPLSDYVFSHWSNENNGTATFADTSSYKTTVRIYADTEIKANFVIDPTKTSLVEIISNVIYASVYVDGSLRGETPATIILNYGTHAIRVVYSGYGEYNETIFVNRPTMKVSALLVKTQ